MMVLATFVNKNTWSNLFLLLNELVKDMYSRLNLIINELNAIGV